MISTHYCSCRRAVPWGRRQCRNYLRDLPTDVQDFRQSRLKRRRHCTRVAEPSAFSGVCRRESGSVRSHRDGDRPTGAAADSLCLSTVRLPIAPGQAGGRFFTDLPAPLNAALRGLHPQPALERFPAPLVTPTMTLGMRTLSGWSSTNGP